jgi:glycosyltransferase involved in cell wall biosynthesis
VSEPLTVAQVLVSSQPGGGPQHVLAVAVGLRARGWRPLVAAPPGGAMLERFREAGVETVPLRADRLSPLTLLRLVRLIRARGVRLVHSHGKGAGVHGRLAARLAGVPAVHTFHGLHYERYAAPVRAAYLALERRLSAATRVVVNVSRAQEQEGLARRLFTARQSRVILNGVDVARLGARALDRWDARAALGLPQSAAVVGTAARFDDVKRLDLLLRAAAAPGATHALALIGAGPEEPALRRLAHDLRLGPRVTFAGEVPEAARLFAAFDVFAAPSRKEGLPLAVVEAMALGLPVVGTRVGGIGDVILDGECGLLVPPEDPGALAEALVELGLDAGRRAKLAAGARPRAEAFSTPVAAAAMRAVYDALVRARGLGR